MTQTANEPLEDVSDTEDGADDTIAPKTEASNGGRSFKTFLHWSLFAVLMLVVLVATFRFYFAASTAVDRLVVDQYRPLFQAGFNLTVLVACGLGLSMLVRRMR